MDSSISIIKLNVGDNSVYIKLIWKETEHELFHIKIFDGDTSWSGRFTKEFAENYRKNFDETKDQYYEIVNKCLTTCHDQFTYHFTSIEEDTANFCWKRKLEDGVKIHGAVPMHRDTSPDSKDSLIDFLLLENKDIRQTLEVYNARTDELSVDLEKCKSELEKFVNIKTSLETSLYGKFVQLLNTKKRRIQVLEDNLQNLDTSAVQQIGDSELD